MKYYMISAVAILMLITSMGIFGFLSKAHNDQNLVSGDVQSKIAIYDEKIKTAKENIEANRKQLKQMDEAVDQVMGRSQDEKGAEKANNIRKSQQRDRVALAKDIETNQKLIATLNDEAAPIRAEIRKVEAEVGPIKYIAKFIYGDHGADENMLEKAVTWIIVLIVIVFDPLAVIMLLAAQMTFGWMREQKETKKELTPPVIVPPVEATPIEEKADIVKETIVAEHPPYQFGDEVHPEDIPSETPLTALGGDITATESQEQKEESELDKWNKMIAEAEAEAMSQQSTVEERVATGETYINNEGKEVALEVDLPESEESKKKTYMTKAPDGTMQVISLNK
jgi:hypothetical protein